MSFIRSFGKASTLEFLPRILALNAGLDATVVLAGLSGAAHPNGNAIAGFNIEGGLDGYSSSSTNEDGTNV